MPCTASVRAAPQRDVELEPGISGLSVTGGQTAHLRPGRPCRRSPDWSVTDIAARMINHNIEHVPVVQDGKVVGILSSFDLVAYLALHGEGEADTAG